LCLLSAALWLAVAARPASAGTVLLSRDTLIHAAGSSFDQQQTASHFDRFANQVGTDAGADGLVTMAHQNGAIGVAGPNGADFTGGFAEGQIRSQAPLGGSSRAQSSVDLVFLVDSRPASYTVGAAMGSFGRGEATIELTRTDSGLTPEQIFLAKTSPGEGGDAGAGRELSQSGFLAPGQYALHVMAQSTDNSRAATESSAYYTFSFSLSDAGVGGTGGPPVAVPLPPAVAAGGSLLALLAVGRFRKSLRKSKSL
jgi:hypothetical protein